MASLRDMVGGAAAAQLPGAAPQQGGGAMSLRDMPQQIGEAPQQQGGGAFEQALQAAGITPDMPGVAQALELAAQGDIRGAADTLSELSWQDGWGGTDGGLNAIDQVYQQLGLGNPRKNPMPDVPDYAGGYEDE